MQLWQSDTATNLRSLVRSTVSDHAVRIREALKAGAKSLDELVAKTGLPADTVRRVLAAMWEAGEVGLDIASSIRPGGGGSGGSGGGPTAGS